MSALKRRGERLSQPVQVRATVSYATMIRLGVLLPALGLTRSQAVGEALRDWTLKREQALNREGRLALEVAMRRAFDRAPLDEVLEAFRGGCVEHSSTGEDIGPQCRIGSRNQIGPASPLTKRPGPRTQRTSSVPSNILAASEVPSEATYTSTAMPPSATLRERREALGLSRAALSRIAGISEPAIAQFENGMRPKESRALPILEATLDEQEIAA